MDALRRSVCVGWIALLLAGPAAGFEPHKDRPKSPAVPPTKEQLDRLLKAYRSYELPEPSADAPLVSFPAPVRTGDHRRHGLGFQLKPVKDGGRIRVFAGAGTIHELERREVAKPVDPRPEALNEIDYGVNELLAAQCHARGWTDLALKVLERRAVDPFEPPTIELGPPETELARRAWAHWLREFRKPETDRAKVARLLKVIWESRREDFTVHDRNKLDALEASLVPGKGKPGTVEALIDGLIEVTRTDRTEVFGGFDKPLPAYMKVARKGFDAVPALIKHLNDERLTRAYKQGFNNFRDYDYTVADVACDLLQGLAGKDIGKSWLDRQIGERLDKADVEKWWADARKVGEEAYFVEHVLDGKGNGNLENHLMADVLAHKYPRRLPEVYHRMLKDHPQMYGWELGEVVANSTLPKETKRDLFFEATRCSGAHIRIDGLSRLLDVDRPKGLEILLAELDRLPETPDGEYWSCPESAIGSLARRVNEPAAWAALEKTARRVDVGLRMEFLNNMLGRDMPVARRKANLRFLGKFLDDATVRNVTSAPKKYGGPHAGFHDFPKIEVRNFVAQQLAWFFKLDAEPKQDWTDAQWARLREDVKKALAGEGIR